MHILVTGGTGSVGQELVKTLLLQKHEVRVLSRDESKQHEMRQAMGCNALEFVIGDIRSFATMREAVCDIDAVFHCAAMKHVPSCEQAPFEAIRTNILGTQNLISAVNLNREVHTVVAVSTDKACAPVGVMGTSKHLMEQLIIQANCEGIAKFVCVRFGNVVPSRGSVFQFFLQRIKEGKSLPVTDKNMTRFLLAKYMVPQILLHTLRNASSGDIWVPDLPSAYITDIATVLRDTKSNPIEYIGVRPGEKIHEMLVSEEERERTMKSGSFFIIMPPGAKPPKPIPDAVSSRYCVLPPDQLRVFLDKALGDLWP
jgi:UDP-glucose 4-epimerase